MDPFCGRCVIIVEFEEDLGKTARLSRVRGSLLSLLGIPASGVGMFIIRFRVWVFYEFFEIDVSLCDCLLWLLWLVRYDLVLFMEYVRASESGCANIDRGLFERYL